MAPNLNAARRHLLEAMVQSSELTDIEIASNVGCTTRSVRAARSNLKSFGSTIGPNNGGGRQSMITPPMLAALLEYLVEKPGLYRDEMVVFLWDEFEMLVSEACIGRVLKREGWSKKVARRIAQERSPQLRDYYQHRISSFCSYHLVFVDESGCDKRIGFRRTGWSPLGTTPVQVAKFQRGERYHILPAYAQDGIVHTKVFQGSTDGDVFEEYIRELLPYLGRYPQPKSVLVMDNASFHHTERIKELCGAAGVLIVPLAPHYPASNPIEEKFAEIKAFVKRNWAAWEDDHFEEFGEFLEWCVEVVGARIASAEGHFRHAGLTIEYP